MKTIIDFFRINKRINKKKKDVELDGLKGKVKQLKEKEFNQDENFFSLIVQYDEFGHRIEKKVYDAQNHPQPDVENKLWGTWVYQHDEKGNMIDRCFNYPNGNLRERNTYKYDEIGNLMERNTYDQREKLSMKYTYKYDRKGNVIEENIFHSDNHLIEKIIYKYDNKSNKIEKNEYEPNGNLICRELNRYNANGDIIERFFMDIKFSSPLHYFYKYEYDSYLNWIAYHRK